MYNHYAFDHAKKLYKEWSTSPEETYSGHLPLVNQWRNARWSSGVPQKQVFKDFHVLFIQHHLGPFIPRIKAMIEDGIQPKDCWFVDIPYSTNKHVWESIKDLGCPPQQIAPPHNNPLAYYCETQVSRTAKIVAKIAEAQPANLLVVDDGAYFLRALQRLREGEKDFTSRFGPDRDQTAVCIVEQTTRGHRHLKDPDIVHIIEDIKAPVVSIARCFTKTKLESVFIGEAVAHGVKKSVQESPYFKKHHNLGQTAILGFGVVGAATTSSLIELSNSLKIDVIDPDTSKVAAINRLGGNALQRLPSTWKASNRYDLVVGCTGYGAFRVDQRMLLKDGAYLVSGSSAAVEFNRSKFIERAENQAFKSLVLTEPKLTEQMQDHETINGSIHTPITLRAHNFDVGDRETSTFYFANAGFPVNFTGDIEGLPMPLIQPTHALLYAASCQAVDMLHHRRYKICELNEDDDIWIFIEGVKQIDDESRWK